MSDSLGYYYTAIPILLLRGSIPYKFRISNPYTIQNIKLWCKLNNKPFELVSDTYTGSHENLKWKCIKEGCKEEFEATWANIYSNYGCPFCAGQKVGLSNCLATKNPELAKEWHPALNGNLTPWDVTLHCSKSAWWVCKECNYIWEAFIYNRGNGNGCPECNQSKGEKECKRVFDLRNIYYISQKTFNGLVGLGNGNLSYDFYLPKYNILIEYQGQYHDQLIHYKNESMEVSEKRFITKKEHDKRKRIYAQNNNIKLLEIWYWDYDNIEEIIANNCPIT